MAANVPCRNNRDAIVELKHIPFQPLTSPSRSKSRLITSMAGNPDAALIEDALVDQSLRARNNASQSLPKAPVYMPQFTNQSVTSPPAIERSDEDAPLLSPTERDYGSANMDGNGNGNGNGNGTEGNEWEWPGEADFAGLPWWKRPSVSAFHQTPASDSH
jgi:hypothetical protein